MKSVNLNYKSLSLLVYVMLVCYWNSNAQSEEQPVNFPTPNAASLGTYGSVPVSHFTGTPNIGVSLHTIKEGALEIPLNLSYNVASVKPNAHPGWTGLGWSLSTGGAITRIIKGFPDEIDNSDEKGYYYNNTNGNLYNLNEVEWSEPEGLKTLAYGNANPDDSYDVNTDEYHFNFLGYSGSFYLNKDLEWEVISDQNVKILFEPTQGGIVTAGGLRASISSAGSLHGLRNFFNEFTIVTEDGTSYKFGGKYATEYSIPYNMQQQQQYLINPSTFYLVKITDVNNNVLATFDYAEGDLICSLEGRIDYHLVTAPSYCSGGGVKQPKSDGFLHFPVYLDKITTRNSIIDFEISETTEIGYPDDELKVLKEQYDSYNNFIGYDYDIPDYFFSNYNEIKWAKLDEITIKNLNNELVKTLNFDYTSSTQERLKLLSVYDDLNDFEYKFDYNPNKMSSYLTAGQDHWGYYTGVEPYIPILLALTTAYQNNNLDSFAADYFLIRNTKWNPTIENNLMEYEVLESITYPTGGFTEFEFEANEYRKYVSREDREDITSEVSNKYCGGLRIKKITSYPSSIIDLGLSDDPIVKEYLYVSGYNGQDPSNLPSSGILGGFQKYDWDHTKDIWGLGQVNLKGFSTNSLLPVAFNTQGSHIGYSEVVELTTGNGYRTYKFTNFDNHEDDNFLGTYNGIIGTLPYSSKSLERGKVTAVIDYDENNIPVKESVFTYAASSSDFIRSVDCFSQQYFCGNGNEIGIAYNGTSYKRYTYHYNLIKKEDKLYTNGQNPITTTLEYKYNSKNLISEEKSWDSNEQLFKTTYTYPHELIGVEQSPYMQQLVDANRVAQPIITKTFKGATKLSENHIKYGYEKIEETLVTLPIEQHVRKGAVNINISSKEDRKMKFTKYDTYGNLVEYRLESGKTVYIIWGYNGQFPIAKIENGYYIEEVFDAVVLDSNTEYNVFTEFSLRIALNNLRNLLPNAMITTYTYDPMIGLTSMTDPKGDMVFYEYDDFNRLRYVRDAEKNVLSKTEYHYQEQN